jgi:hypothetical protein
LKQVKVWKWIGLAIGICALILGIFLIQQYFMAQSTMITNADPETIWEGFGLIFAFAGVGSVFLAIGLVSFGIGAIIVIIVIVRWSK